MTIDRNVAASIAVTRFGMGAKIGEITRAAGLGNGGLERGRILRLRLAEFALKSIGDLPLERRPPLRIGAGDPGLNFGRRRFRRGRSGIVRSLRAGVHRDEEEQEKEAWNVHRLRVPYPKTKGCAGKRNTLACRQQFPTQLIHDSPGERNMAAFASGFRDPASLHSLLLLTARGARRRSRERRRW